MQRTNACANCNVIKAVLLWFMIVSPLFLSAQQKTINSGWQFNTEKNKDNPHFVNLPHTWNSEDAFDDTAGYFRGKGFYKKKIFFSNQDSLKIHYLKFNAVNQLAKVKLNGILLGEHRGGYTAFLFNISPHIEYDAYNIIEVEVDNAHNVDIPPLDADFTFYGGIYRDVELISLPKQHFSISKTASDGFRIEYNDVSEDEASLSISAQLENFHTKSEEMTLVAHLYDEQGLLLSEKKQKVNLGAKIPTDVELAMPKISNPNLWSPDSPYLYKFRLELLDDKGITIQKKSAKVGFRWFKIDPEKGFFLNGKPIKLIGVNRHQDFKGYGNAVPLGIQAQDIRDIKSMGANFIRFAHYPHHRGLYELCDELGILVWTEIPIVNKVTESEEFFDTSIRMQEEHIMQYYNHTAVVMFGYMNEIFLRLAFDGKSTDKVKEKLKTTSYKLAERLEELTRRLAPNHLTVMAVHFNELYNETGIADLPMVLGWNLYFGWYHDTIDDLSHFLDEQHKRYPKRCLFLSEYGPGADQRIFTEDPKIYDFSTDYQLLLHKGYLKQVQDRDYVMGMTAWNFADFGSEFRGDARPHINQKGLVNYDRTPKDIYYWYKANLNTKEPFAHVATDKFNGLQLLNKQSYPVSIFSNEEKAELYLNDSLLGSFDFEGGSLLYDFQFKNGTNKIVVEGNEFSTTKTMDIIKSNIIDFKDFKHLGISLGSHFYFKDEESGIFYLRDKAYDSKLYGYLDGISNTANNDKNQGIPYNIRNTELDPLYQTMLIGCSKYRIDVPSGQYKITLYFVEPKLKPIENLYALTATEDIDNSFDERIFNIYLNQELVQPSFNMAQEFPEKYGIALEYLAIVDNDNGLTISLEALKGETVISGVLIEKLME